MKYCKLTNSGTGTDHNGTDVLIPWGNVEHIDSPPFTYDSGNEAIEVQEDGVYEFRSLLMTGTSSYRTNPVARFKLNGTTYLEGWGGSGYASNRDGHDWTTNAPHVIEELTAGDYVQVETFAEARGGSCNPRANGENNFFAKKIPALKYAGGNPIEGEESGTISNGSIRPVAVSKIEDGAEISISSATFTSGIGGPVPSSFDMKIVTMSNTGTITDQVTVLSGDGNSTYDSMPGAPLASWTNSTGAAVTVGVVVDNQSGSAQTFMSGVEGIIK